MISFDTNILFPAVVQADSYHPQAAGFLRMLQDRDDVMVSEFCLVELYNLLRNPAVIVKPLSAPEAVTICQHFRHHPRWRIAGFGTEGGFCTMRCGRKQAKFHSRGDGFMIFV